MKLKLPNSWDGVTVGEYQAIRSTLAEDGDPYLIECAIISTLSGKDMDVIMALTRDAHGKIMTDTLSFLHTEVKGKLKNRVKLKGQRYYIETDIKNITGGQYVDLTHFMKETDTDKNLHNLLACLAVKTDWKRIKQPYNGANHSEVAELMQGLPITIVKPITDFFLSSYVTLLKNIAAYLLKTGTEMKAKATEQLTNSSKSTGGSTQYTASRTAGASYGTSTLT